MEGIATRTLYSYANLMSMPKTRGLGVIRLSKSADPASTSIPKQQEIIQGFADSQNIVIVGWAIDPAVSAFHIPPEKRKQIKRWLERHEEYDCLIYWRQDRLVRRVFDFVGLVKWCRDLNKKLYSSTEALGDVTQHAGMLVGLITAWQAEGESINTGDRVRPTKERLAREGRYSGGRIAYWQVSICICHELTKCPEGTDCKGWKLVPNEKIKAPLIREAARRVTAGESVNAVIADFNRRNIPANDSGQEYPDGRRPSGLWLASTLRDILRNRNLMDGLLSPDEWGQLQDALDSRAANRQVRTLGRDSLILDLVFCGHCGGKVYRWRTHGRRPGQYYEYGQCRNRHKRYEVIRPCVALGSVPYQTLEDAVRKDIEDHWDDIIETRVTNVTRKLRAEEIDRELMSLAADMAAKRISRSDFIARQTSLLDEAEALETDEGGPRWQSADETVGQRWSRLSDAERRLWLLRIGTTYTVTKETRDDGAHRWVIVSSWRTADSAEYRERVIRAA